MPKPLTTEEFIYRAKKVHGNKYDYSKFVNTLSTVPSTIICHIHGEFKQQPSIHLQGSGCMQCGIDKKHLSTDEYIKKARSAHGNKYDYSNSIYNGCYEPIKIKCNVCHNHFTMKASNHINSKNGCNICNSPHKYTVEEFIEQAKSIHGEEFDYTKVSYINSKTKIVIRCKKHGDFLQTPNSHLRGTKCPTCKSENRQLSTDEFITTARHKYGELYDYSRTKYINSKTKVEIICAKHGSFWQSPRSHLYENGCEKCHREHTRISFITRERNEEFIQRLQQKHGKKYDYSQVFLVDYKTKILIKCPHHGEFKQLPFQHLNGTDCPRCKNTVSKKELAFLKLLNITENQVKIGTFHVDGIDPTTNIIYEFLGDYWHGNPKIYEYNKFNKTTKTSFGELYDFCFNYKFNILKNKGYTVKYIWENDWDIWLKDKTQPLPIKEY